MNVMFVMVITHHVQIVQELQTAQHPLISVVFVMQTVQMTVFKIVLVHGVVMQ